MKSCFISTGGTIKFKVSYAKETTRIKVGDTVKVIKRRRQKVKKAKFLRIDKKERCVLVLRSVNIIKKHVKPSASRSSRWYCRSRSRYSHFKCNACCQRRRFQQLEEKKINGKLVTIFQKNRGGN
jgi:hypothetical protein